jgi:hypothetical protein
MCLTEPNYRCCGPPCCRGSVSISRSKNVVRTVAKWGIIGGLAAAQIDDAGGFHLELAGAEGGTFVRSVAKGLILGTAAGAP